MGGWAQRNAEWLQVQRKAADQKAREQKELIGKHHARQRETKNLHQVCLLA